VTVLEWLDGEPLDRVERGDDLALAIGGSLANFHAAIRAIDQKQQLKQGRRFVRLEYGAALLGRADQELLTAYQAGRVTATQLRTMSLTLQEIGRRLRKLDRIPELASLVHADLAPSNLLRTDQGIALIDFSLSGYAHWPMDLASLFDHFRGPTEHAAIVAGYEQVSGCPVDPTWIEDYQALGVLLVVAGHHRQYGDEDWFPSKLDRWCETIFAPLLTQ
jgi:Ser/Thr protein kinase RdoA (MazF antagonist)